ADNSCAANTCPGAPCSDACGNSFNGTKAPDNTCAANTCTGRTCTDSCGNTFNGLHGPDNSCAANTCFDATCTDSCGNNYQGTKACPPAVTSALTVTGTVGFPFSYQLAATHGPTSFDLAPVPCAVG